MKKKGYFIIIPDRIDVSLIRLYNLIQDEWKIDNDDISIKEIEIYKINQGDKVNDG